MSVLRTFAHIYRFGPACAGVWKLNEKSVQCCATGGRSKLPVAVPLTRRPTAVDLDELLATLTPETVAELSRQVPPGWTDQLNAAADQSMAVMEAAEGAPVRCVPRSAIDDWIRLPLLGTFLEWVDGRGATCAHLPSWRRPEPVWAAGWKPGLVVCARCLHLLKLVGEADRICDCCGRLVAGIEHDDGIRTPTVFLGAMAYQAGACRDCLPPEADNRGCRGMS